MEREFSCYNKEEEELNLSMYVEIALSIFFWYFDDIHIGFSIWTDFSDDVVVSRAEYMIK